MIFKRNAFPMDVLLSLTQRPVPKISSRMQILPAYWAVEQFCLEACKEHSWFTCFIATPSYRTTSPFHWAPCGLSVLSIRYVRRLREKEIPLQRSVKRITENKKGLESWLALPTFVMMVKCVKGLNIVDKSIHRQPYALSVESRPITNL